MLPRHGGQAPWVNTPSKRLAGKQRVRKQLTGKELRFALVHPSQLRAGKSAKERAKSGVREGLLAVGGDEHD